MVSAFLADVWTALWVFWGIQVAEVLELIIRLHMCEDGFALPVDSFEGAVFWAFLADSYFAVDFG